MRNPNLRWKNRCSCPYFYIVFVYTISTCETREGCMHMYIWSEDLTVDNLTVTKWKPGNKVQCS